MIKRALLSVFDKTGIVDFAKELQRRGVQLLSTGGTYKALKDAHLPVTEVAEYTGFPEMMDGRVKTLHPRIHGGLLCVRDDPHHMEAARANDIGMIDLVVVNLYPFEATADKPGATTEDKIENIKLLVRDRRWAWSVPVDLSYYEDSTPEQDREVGSA